MTLRDPRRGACAGDGPARGERRARCGCRYGSGLVWAHPAAIAFHGNSIPVFVCVGVGSIWRDSTRSAAANWMRGEGGAHAGRRRGGPAGGQDIEKGEKRKKKGAKNVQMKICRGLNGPRPDSRPQGYKKKCQIRLNIDFG